MFGTLKTLIVGANARAEEQVRDVYAIELIDQKVREASANLKAAKVALAGLIQRERGELRQIETLEGRTLISLNVPKRRLQGSVKTWPSKLHRRSRIWKTKWPDANKPKRAWRPGFCSCANRSILPIAASLT